MPEANMHCEPISNPSENLFRYRINKPTQERAIDHAPDEYFAEDNPEHVETTQDIEREQSL